MFEKLGGTRAVERIDCDTDYEDTAPEWITKALDAMSKVEPAPAPQPEAGSGKELIVFFGSQTGNAEELAQSIVDKANEEYGMAAVLEDM